MLELATYRSLSYSNQKNWDDLTTSEKVSYIITTTVILILYICIYVWALTRAAKQKNKPLHMLFALISPVAYLIFSYYVDGFNN